MQKLLLFIDNLSTWIGQAFSWMIVGLTLLDFPGRRRLEARVLRAPRILRAINRVRARFDRLPLELD